MTESMLETSSQPGLILKTAREEMSLSIEQVAQELHLRPAVVKALEEEKYSEFSSDVFLKGYFRTYCRLVKLHEERMIELLEKQLNSIKEETDKSQEQIIKAKYSRKRRKQFVTLFIFIACASMVYLAYLVSTQSISFLSDEPETEATQIIDPVKTPEIQAEKDSSADADTEDAEKPVLQDSSLNHDDTFPESIDQAELKAFEETKTSLDESAVPDTATLSSSTPYSGTTQSNAADADSYEQPQVEETTEITEISDAANSANLKALFTGDCWFKLTDGNSKTVIADLKRANDQINYQGVPPFHIVIGDASKVSMTFDGEKVDLAAYSSRNGRAELNLRKKDAQSRGE